MKRDRCQQHNQCGWARQESSRDPQRKQTAPRNRRAVSAGRQMRMRFVWVWRAMLMMMLMRMIVRVVMSSFVGARQKDCLQSANQQAESDTNYKQTRKK